MPSDRLFLVMHDFLMQLEQALGVDEMSEEKIEKGFEVTVYNFTF